VSLWFSHPFRHSLNSVAATGGWSLSSDRGDKYMRRAVTVLISLVCATFFSTVFGSIDRTAFAYGLMERYQPMAGEDAADVGTPPFRVYTDRDGLPQNSAMAIAFDLNGYLWVGTEDGAACYNGRRWNVVNMPNRSISNYIRTILAASDGSIWFGTDGGGLTKLKDGKWVNYDTDSGLPGNRVWSLLETTTQSGESTLWVGTANGLGRLKDNSWTIFNRESGLPDNRVYSLLETTGQESTRVLWVGTGGGLARMENGRWTIFKIDSGLPNNQVLSLLETTAQNGARLLWAGTYGGGLARLENGEWTTFDTRSGLPGNRVWCLLETTSRDGARTVWAGTDSGPARFINGHWKSFDTRSGLPNNSVRKLLEVTSKNGTRTIWIGTFGGGLVRLERGRWTSFDTRSGLPNNIVLSLLETTSKSGARSFWVGTLGGGLARLEKGEWTVFDTGSGLPSKLVWCLLETAAQDGTSSLWAGTDGGLARLENGKWTVFDTRSGLPNNQVLSLLETASKDGGRVLWAGTLSGGLARLENGEWTVFDTGSGLPSSQVYCLLETGAKQGARTLWVGTRGGLARLENGNWTVFDKRSGLPANLVYSLLETIDRKGTHWLWVGTSGGVSRLDLSSNTANWITFSDSTKPALPNNVVYQIREDSKRRIYLFTNKGIARLTPRVPTTDDSSEYSIHSFNVEDGLPSNECNQGASVVDKEGRIWGGTIRGAAMFDPSEEIEDISPKPLLVERRLLAGKERRLFQNDSLAYNENNLQFEYVLLSYFRESETLYRTELVGFDGEPSAWTSDYKKEYSALPEGDYIFKVWGRDYAGNLTGPVSIPFRIRPAPWRTWWAYFLYFGLTASIGYGTLRYRLKALQHRNEILEAKIEERTSELAEKVELLRESEKRALDANRAKSIFLANMSHELRTPLNAILGFAQLMERDRRLYSEQRENLSIINRSGEHLLALINDVLSLSKIEAGRLALNEKEFDLRLLLQSLEEMFRVRAQAKGLELFFHPAAEVPHYVHGDGGKLRQVLINLLGNAIKFTNVGSVTLRLSWFDGWAAFEVEDTGEGISEEETEKIFKAFEQTASGQRSKEGTGLGLTISRNFIRLMGGDIRVKSRLGEGSSFSFEIRLPAATGTESQQSERRVIGLEPGQPAYRVLVVDDRWENRALLLKLLESVGPDVRVAVDGKEAVEIWTDWRPDLILIDMRMPVMDGYSAVKKIREIEAVEGGAPVRIIALTASAFEHNYGEMLSAGCDDYILKPFSESTIFEKMVEHLGIRFLYEGDSEAVLSGSGEEKITPGRLAQLPSEWIAELGQALTDGDVRAIYGIIDNIQERDETLAKELKSMVKSYRFAAIKAMIEKI
jgi:signal transduction histidine kinase/ligand-binding sensor domain-containing protein/DNA-binding NarL/FixJ family response regulator